MPNQSVGARVEEDQAELRCVRKEPRRLPGPSVNRLGLPAGRAIGLNRQEHQGKPFILLFPAPCFDVVFEESHESFGALGETALPLIATGAPAPFVMQLLEQLVGPAMTADYNDNSRHSREGPYFPRDSFTKRILGHVHIVPVL